MTNPTSAEYQLAVARLAQLSTDQYEHVRKDEAKRLGVRVSQLDEDVKRARLARTVPETADDIVKEFNRRFLVVNEAGRVLVYPPGRIQCSAARFMSASASRTSRSCI